MRRALLRLIPLWVLLPMSWLYGQFTYEGTLLFRGPGRWFIWASTHPLIVGTIDLAMLLLWLALVVLVPVWIERAERRAHNPERS